MKFIIPFVLLISSLCISCANDTQAEQKNREIAQNYNDSILKIIDKNWNFKIPMANAVTKSQLADWQGWNAFITELNQKPIKSLSAYRSKTDNLTKISDELLTSIPEKLATPAINSRLNTINATIKHLNSFLSLEAIPVNKVITLQQNISNQVNSIFTQIEEAVIIKNIPTEKGEDEMIKNVLDTTRRANFNFEKALKDDQPVNNDINLNESSLKKGSRRQLRDIKPVE